MNQLFCTHEISLLLKQLGFNEKCIALWITNTLKNTTELTPVTQNLHKGYWQSIANNEIDVDIKTTCLTAPTWEQALSWIRTNLKYHLYACLNGGRWYSSVKNNGTIPIKVSFPAASTYEEAIESSMVILLKRVIELTPPKERFVVDKNNLFECAAKLGFKNPFPTGIKGVEQVAILEAELMLKLWLRDSHHEIDIVIGSVNEGCFIEEITMLNSHGDPYIIEEFEAIKTNDFKTYSEALEAALISCIQKLIDNNPN